jgi:hypothetical protein
MYRVMEWLQTKQGGKVSVRSLSCLQAHSAMVHYLGNLVNLHLTIKAIYSHEHGGMHDYAFMMIELRISNHYCLAGSGRFGSSFHE